MKVTVNLDEALVKLAKHEAVERDLTLQALIEEGLRAILSRKRGSKNR